MAAGTGGHVIPGLAVAREMQARGWTVSWLGTTHGMENRLVPPSGIPMDAIAFSGLRGKGLLHTLTGGLRLLGAFWHCLRILRAVPPTRCSAWAAMSASRGLMASLLGKPLVLVNADAALLLSNRWLLPVADRVAFGFDGEAARGIRRAVVTGNPVRAEIEALPAPEARFAGRSGPLRLLVVGGSLGARVLNECLPRALALCPAGRGRRSRTRPAKRTWRRCRPTTPAPACRRNCCPSSATWPGRLAECDVVVCRAGAVTVSELCAAGVASVLVPLVVSTTSHQRDNAAHMAAHGAAIHLPQTELSPQRLADLLRGLTRPALLAMAQRARAIAIPHAASRVADEIQGLVAA